MYSVWFGCKTCRRSFLKLDDLFEHKKVHRFVKQGVQRKDKEQTMLFPTLKAKSGLNSESEPALATSKNHKILEDANTLKKSKFSTKSCSNITPESNSFSSSSSSEAGVNLPIISVTSASKEYNDNSSHLLGYKYKIFQPAAELKQIGLTNSRNTDNSRYQNVAGPGQCSKIQQENFNHNENQDDGDNLSLSVQSQIPATENQSLHNSDALPRRLTSTQSQNISSRVETETETQQVQSQDLSSFENSDDIDHDQNVDSDLAIFPRSNVEILEECDKGTVANFTCKFCKSHFISCSNLQMHLQICVTFVQTSHSYCGLCNSHFSSSYDLQAHNRSQHGRKMDNRFRQFCKNRKQAGVISVVQPYKCNVCRIWFVTEASLNNHLIAHTEETPFGCPYPGCNKAFKTVHILASHRATHYTEFSCKFPSCNLTFESKESLKEHVRTHISK